MSEKVYQIVLDEENSIFVYFETKRGKVTAFVVKYLASIEGKIVEVLRYDSGHGVAHIDVLHPDGGVYQKIWLHHLTNDQALTGAREDIERNYKFYRERYIVWQKQQRKK